MTSHWWPGTSQGFKIPRQMHCPVTIAPSSLPSTHRLPQSRPECQPASRSSLWTSPRWKQLFTSTLEMAWLLLLKQLMPQCNVDTSVNLPVPFPLQETLLCRYASNLASQGLKHKTIKAYLSGLRFAQIHLIMGNPFKTADMPQLDYVLTGIKRVQAKQQLQPKPRLPITMDIMRSLKSSWVETHSSQDNTMLWTAACTGFFPDF